MSRLGLECMVGSIDGSIGTVMYLTCIFFTSLPPPTPFLFLLSFGGGGLLFFDLDDPTLFGILFGTIHSVRKHTAGVVAMETKHHF